MALKKNEIQAQLLIILHEFIQELGTVKAQLAIDIDARLENDLGLGSLERAEIFHRIEKHYEIRLPETLLADIKTLNDLIEPIQQANPARLFRIDEFSPVLEQSKAIPTQATTLVEILQHYVEHFPERPHIFIQDEFGVETTITYEKMFNSAQLVANGLVHHGLKPGETVAIMLPTCAQFFYAFFGVLLAGGVPVPIYPPMRPQQIEIYIQHESSILNNAEVRIMIIFHEVVRLSKILQSFIPSLTTLCTVEVLQTESLVALSLDIAADDPALIQYTSGSTGNPKGVLLTHNNLLANIRAYGQALDILPTDVVVSWLPLYHDMGLIGSWLGSLYYGIPLTVLSPITFLLHPERWLWAIHYHRATISAGPNFAYELCIKRLNEKTLEGLDLSCWRSALNGAEAIYPNTLRCFSEKFAPYGFKVESLIPVYGLAECSVALSIPQVRRKFIIDKIDYEKFSIEQIAVKMENDNNKTAIEFICCGKPLPKHEIRVVDDAQNPVVDRVIGEIQFKGPSTMQGYFRNPSATQTAYRDGWWATGDYGYLVDGEIYLTGRKKDIIVKAGRNLSPEGPEEVTSTVAGIRKGCVVAFGVADSVTGTERFIIVAETRETLAVEHARIIAQVNEKIAAAIGIPPDEVVLVSPKTIPKTSSGKLQHSACREAFLQGNLTKRKTPVWLQMTKLFALNLWKKTAKYTKQFFCLLFGGYVSLVLCITLPIIWIVVKLSSQNIAAKIIRSYSRSLLFLCGCPLKVTGAKYLHSQPPVIFAANHSSYIDAVILHAILPSDVAFIGKQELLKVPFIRTFFKKLDHITVNRLDFMKSIEETEQIKKTLQNGRSILFFPEGTFAYATGLRPFKLGAFKLAADTSLPICPIAIKGARRILRSGSYLPVPGHIEVTVTGLIQPQGNELREIGRLAVTTRSSIGRYSGEATLDLTVAGYQHKQSDKE